jgi:hypothetical protein
MRLVFGFFLRLFLCFVGAKFLLRVFDVAGRDYLLALTAVLLINAYLFEYLVFRDRAARGSHPEAAPEKPPEDPPPSNHP